MVNVVALLTIHTGRDFALMSSNLFQVSGENIALMLVIVKLIPRIHTTIELASVATCLVLTDGHGLFRFSSFQRHHA